MISAITDWVKTIILVVLFASFLELLLPASSMQRFIRVIMGLLVMLTILNPVVDFIQARSLPEQLPAFSNRTADGTGRPGAGPAIADEKNRLAVEVYKKDLSRQIRAVVLAVDGVADARVSVQLKNEGDSRSGALDKIQLAILPGKSGAGPKIQPVSIAGPGATKPAEPSAQLRENIARTVRELYQLRDGQVEIQPWN
ncbi:MAG: stage III sporulation protein AF [Negativicutes bacterium]|nr:stage III sporulation protein AF [Negativicutes bacterium]